ncbi:MAG: SDR family oxidoreductase, partial [Anaerolineae bacterium]|nr:SDR family oxidoreductase [Anaerolineae bacterium]
LDLARAARRLRQFGHVSTVHIAGRRVGVIHETELEHDAGWVNTYEQTKYEAERRLRAGMAELPITVYRMSSVVGDSRTGEVRQFNFLHQLLRLVWAGLVPALPADPHGPVDLIASDWVADALVELFERRFVPGETLHLCAGADRAYTLAEILDVTLAEFDRWLPAGRRRPAPPALVSLDEFTQLVEAAEAEGRQRQAQALGAIATFTPHLALPKAFDNRLARAALEPLGVAWPPIRDYYPRVVEYCVKSGWGRVALPPAAQETSHATGSAAPR